MRFRNLISAIIVILCSLFMVPVASAHNTQPRVEINMERLNPGGVVDVRGVSFGMEEPVTLTLIGASAEIPLGEMLSDAEGGFLHIAVLPADLVAGTYYFRAVTSHHFVLSPPLTVWGTAVVEGGGQGERDEDDGLLAPMPTFAPAAVTASAPLPQTEPAPASGPNRTLPTLMVLTVLGILIAAGVLVMRRTKQ